MEVKNQEKTNELEISILIVDDDERFRTRLQKSLKSRGFDVRAAADYDEAMALCREDSPEWAILDLKMPQKSGLVLLADLLALDPTIKILMLTGYGSIATAVDAVKLGAIHYLTKPAEIREILQAFEKHTDLPKSIDRLDQDHEYNVPSLARVEWEHIQRVLNDTQGNISQCAKLLGIHRRSLQRKLSKDPVIR